MSDLWSSFAHDPRDRAHAGLRASDADRERIAGVLSAAYADGRLEREELDERMDAAASARTLGDLPPLVADLVPMRPPPVARTGSLVALTSADLHERALETWRTRRRGATLTFVTVLVVTGFVATFDVYWPLVFAVLSLLNVVRVLASRDDTVRDEVRRLQRKQARQQRWPRGLT